MRRLENEVEGDERSIGERWKKASFVYGSVGVSFSENKKPKVFPFGFIYVNLFDSRKNKKQKINNFFLFLETIMKRETIWTFGVFFPCENKYKKTKTKKQWESIIYCVQIDHDWIAFCSIYSPKMSSSSHASFVFLFSGHKNTAFGFQNWLPSSQAGNAHITMKSPLKFVLTNVAQIKDLFFVPILFWLPSFLIVFSDVLIIAKPNQNDLCFS